MTTRTEILSIRLETSGDGQIKATLGGISKESLSAANSVDKLNKEIQEIRDRADPAGAALRKLAGDKAVLNRAVKEGILTQQAANTTLGQLNRQALTSSQGFRTMSQAVGAIGLAEVVRQSIQTVVEFQRLGAVLRVLEGSQEGANAKMRELRELSNQIPGDLAQIVQAYQVLKARGLDATRESIIAYANVAAASGKTTKDFIEAVADAATNQNERLLEFGIKAETAGNKIRFTFQGVTTEVENNAKAIEGFLRGIGENQFAGAAAAQMDTLGGAIESLLGSVSELVLALGDSGLTLVFTELVLGVTEGIRALTQMQRSSNETASALGPIEAAIKGASAAVFTIMAAAEMAGAGLGALIETLSAARDAVGGLLSALGDYAAALAKIKSLDFAGAQAGIEQSVAAGAAAVAQAQERVRAAAENMGSSTDDILGKLTGRFEQLFAASSQSAAGVTKVGDAAAVAAGDIDKTDKATADLIAKLREQAATTGLTRVAMLEFQKAQAVAAAGTDAQRKEVAALYDTIIRKTRAEEAATKATKEDTKAKAQNKREADELKRITEQQVRAAMQLVEAYDIVTRQTREFADAERDTAAAVKEGAITAEQRAKVLADLRFDQIIEQVRELGEEFKGLPSKLPFGELEWRDVGQRAGGGFLDAFTDVLLGGDAGDIGKRFAEALLGDTFRTSLEQLVGRPLQQIIGSGGGLGDLFNQIFSGRSFESDPNFVGPPSALAGQQSGVSAQSAFQAAGAVYGIYQANRQGGAGGAISGAASGAALGTMIMPGIGTAIGAIIGGVVGLLGGGSDPNIRIGGPGRTRRPEASTTTAFGRLSYGAAGLEGGEAQIVQAVQQFDAQMASLFRTMEDGPETVRRVTQALAGWSVDLRDGEANAQEVLSRRLDAIIQAAEPAWARMLGNIDDLQSRVEAFSALYNIRDQIDALEESAATLGGSPLEQLRAQLANLGDDVTRTAAALAAAIEAQDPVAIRDAAAAAQEAVLARFNAEIQLARDLEAAILDAQAAARATQLQLAQRIQATGGPAGLVAGVAAGNIATLRGQVSGTADPVRALAFLGEFTASVDAWLQASIADVQTLANAETQRVQAALAGIAAQRDALQQALAELTAERDTIMAEASARTQAENSAAQAQAQAVMAAQEEMRRAELERLQQALGIAEEFKRVLDDAERMVKELTFTSANPLGGFARLDLLGNAISQAEARVAGSSGSDRAAAASELLDLLQQRLGLVQQEGLFQRPSGEYLDVYNDTLRRIAQVQGVAQPEADRALDLQQRIADLSQQTTDAIVSMATGGVRYTADEQARLDAIAEEEKERQLALAALAEEEAALNEEMAEIQRRMDAEITALNATAREQYEWARGEAQRLEDQRQADLMAQLDELTGGRPVDQFIADRTAEAASLLTEIRDDLRAFLEGISSGSVGGSATPGIGIAPGGGRDPFDNRPIGKDNTGELSKPGVFAPVININSASGDPQQIARAVSDTINRELPQFATRLKRELTHA